MEPYDKMRKSRILLTGLLLALVVSMVAGTASAEETFLKGRGALFAQGNGMSYMDLRYGATVWDVSDSVIVVHDSNPHTTSVWAEGGHLARYGNTWIFTGSGRLHTRGMGYFIAALGDVDKMLGIGYGSAVLNGEYETLALGWNMRAQMEPEMMAKVADAQGILDEIDAASDAELDGLISEMIDEDFKEEAPVKNKVRPVKAEIRPVKLKKAILPYEAE